jgi:hypothetical protein
MSRILHNWTLKLMALVLAVALWSHVRGEVNPLETATFTTKIDLNAPSGWSIQDTSTIPKSARVTLRAPRNTLRELKGVLPLNPLAPPDAAPPLPSLKAHLDFPILKAGESTATIKVESQIEDAEIIGIKPADAVVSLVKNSQ